MTVETNQTALMANNRDKELFESIQILCGLYLIPIVCIPGLIGNILCIIVFVTNSMQRVLSTQSLVFLAVADTVKLSNDLLYSIVLIIQTINHRIGKNVFLTLYRYCHYINTVSTLSTAWLTLLIAIERFALCNGNNQKRVVVQRNSRRICFSLICFCLLFALPVVFRYEIARPTGRSNETSTNADVSLSLSSFGRSRFFRSYSIFSDVIRAIVPSLLLFYLNTRIVYLLCLMKSSAGTTFYRLTMSLIIIIGCFICCYFPDALLSLILNVGYIDETYPKRAIREITDFFVTLNSAVNFLVYFSISYVFRRSVLRLLQRKRKSYCPTTYADIIQRQHQQAQLLNHAKIEYNT